MRKVLSLVMALALVLSLATVAFAAETSFTDVKEDSYYVDSIAWAVEKEITTGYGDGTFGPDDNCSRGQVVTFLNRYAGNPTASEEAAFTDLPEGGYFNGAIAWAVENGITTGYGETFGPDDNCTRGQVVTFLWRYAGEPVVSTELAFTDVAADSYYVNAIAWAVENGITTGLSATTFGPDQDCTRGQVVTFLYRYANNRLGSENNPVVINNASELDAIVIAGNTTDYYAISGQLNGKVLTVVAADGVTVTVNGTALVAEDGLYTAVLDKAPMNQVIVANAGEKAVEMVASINDPLGSENNPIVVNNASELTSVAAAAGSETYYAISGQLNGLALNIAAADDVTVTVNGTALVAENGAYSVVLDKAPMNQVIIANAGEEAVELAAAIEEVLGSENNPIIITSAAELTSVEAAAGSETYYAISGQLNGMVLTVAAADDVTVTVNGTALVAENDVYEVTLDKAPMNQVVVANAGEKAVELVASIHEALGTENNPYVINNADEMNAITVPAGGKVYYAISGQLNGNFVHIQSTELTTVTVNGTAVEADDEGYCVVELNKAPMNQVVVENSGDEACELIAYIQAAPGSETNPIWITEDVTIVNIGAGETVYLTGRLGGKEITVENAANVVAEYNGKTYQGEFSMWGCTLTFEIPATEAFPAPMETFSLTNNNEEDSTYYVIATTPVYGTMDKPLELTDISSIDVAIEEGNYMGYYMTWTAEADGVLTLSVSNCTEGVEYDFNMTNMSTYASAWLVDSTDGNVSLAVSAGDVVNICVNVVPDANWNYPAADITMVGSFA